MLQLKNNTPFASTMALFPDEAGVDTLYIISKASFHIGSQWTLLEKQPPPMAEDIYWEEPGTSSIKYASDYHIGKMATDVIVNGHAHAPEGQSVRQMDVSIMVGQARKSIRVFGDRQWDNGRISSPLEFQQMPLMFERAFGGVQMQDDQIVSGEMRNPIGRGYIGNRTIAETQGMALPNLEDPAALIKTPKDRPNPACSGFIAPHWEPRVSFAGTYDDVWQKTRSPYLPKDFNRRFLSMAHPDLVYPGHLQGGEPVIISGMHPGADLQFNIPHIKLVSQVFIRNQVSNPQFNMETLVIEPDKLQISMVWKAAIKCDKQALRIRAVNINMSR